MQLLRSSMSINFLRRGKDLVMTIIKLKRLTIVVYHKSIVKNCQQISWTLKPTMVTKMLRRSLHWKYCSSSVFPYFFASQAPLKVAHSLLCSHFVSHLVLKGGFFLTYSLNFFFTHLSSIHMWNVWINVCLKYFGYIYIIKIYVIIFCVFS